MARLAHNDSVHLFLKRQTQLLHSRVFFYRMWSSTCTLRDPYPHRSTDNPLKTEHRENTRKCKKYDLWRTIWSSVLESSSSNMKIGNSGYDMQKTEYLIKQYLSGKSIHKIYLAMFRKVFKLYLSRKFTYKSDYLKSIYKSPTFIHMIILRKLWNGRLSYSYF